MQMKVEFSILQKKLFLSATPNFSTFKHISIWINREEFACGEIQVELFTFGEIRLKIVAFGEIQVEIPPMNFETAIFNSLFSFK